MINNNYRNILKSIYLKLYKYGYKEISINNDDLKCYVPEIEYIFNECNIISDDLFVKTPVLETYDQYKNILIDIFISNGLGYFNETYDAIIIKTYPYYINKQIEEMHQYIKLIDKCCNVFIDKDMNRNNNIKLKRVIK